MPGALSYVFLTASRTEADLARVAVIQVFRIFVLMAIVPMVARLSVGAAIPHFASDPLAVTAARLALGAAAGAALERFGVANGGLYAGILISATAPGAGLAPGRLTPDLQIAAQALVGAWVGVRFIGFDWRLLRQLGSPRRRRFSPPSPWRRVFPGSWWPRLGFHSPTRATSRVFC